MKGLLAAAFVATGLAAAGPASASDWTGFYLGADAGVALGSAAANTSTIFSPIGYFAASSVTAIDGVGAQRIGGTGFTGGAQVGFNWQSGNLLFGTEADLGVFDVSGARTSTAVYPCCSPNTFTVHQAFSTDWLLTLRPRLGVVDLVPNTLVYATAGLAMTTVNYKGIFTDNFAAAHESAGMSNMQMGWTIGGGGEYKIDPHWSLKGEYLYMDFGNMKTTSNNLTAFTPIVAFPANQFTHTIDLRASVIKFGVNYHF